MTETPIPRLICSMAVPTITTMLITSVYNMADTFFVSQIDTSATGAVGIVFSLMALIQAVGFTFGMGSGNYISRLLGQKNRERANRVAATGFFSALLCGLVLLVFGLLFVDPLMHLLGATDTIFPYAKAYASYILIAAPYMAGSFVLNNILRAQGSAFHSMLGIGTGALLNIVLDPIFIFVFGLGISGAAIATILSQLVSFVILLTYCTEKRGNVPIRPKNITFEWPIYKEILKTGMPSFYRQSLASVATVCLNVCARPFGDPAIAAMSIVNRYVMFLASALLGFGQGFQPVCGFNYGAKNYDRVREGFWFCVRVAFIALCILGAASFLLAPQIITAFRRGDPAVIEIGTTALRAASIVLPVQSGVILVNMFSQATGHGLQTSIISLARQGLFFIPFVLILPQFLGIHGVQLAQPAADVCTFLLALPIGASTLKSLKKQELSGRRHKLDQASQPGLIPAAPEAPAHGKR